VSLNAKVEAAFNATPEGQKRMCSSADERIRVVLRTFNEVQQGPNPLTVDEVAKLIELRPHVYGCLRNWVEKRRG